MKTLLQTIFVTSLLLSSSLFAKQVPDNDEGWHSHRPMLELQERLEEKRESKKNALEILDRLLSPFEDMTECALDKNAQGMKKGYENTQTLKDSKLLAEAISKSAYEGIISDIDNLQALINAKNYSKVALLSTSIFKKITNNFEYSEYVKNQIHIENLDAMGFELLSLLGRKDLNYTQLQSITEESQKHWMVLRDELKDENSIDAFDLLLKALLRAVINHDKEMIKILASMELALVDIVEKQLQQKDI